MAIYSRATSRGDWTGEWDVDAATKLMLRLDSFVGDTDPRPTPDVSGQGQNAVVVNYANAAALPTPWGAGIRLNNDGISAQSSIRIENDGTLFPDTGSLLVGTWVNCKNDQQWNPVLSTRGTAGEAPLFHLAINGSSSGQNLLNYRLYDESGTTIVNGFINTYDIPADTWVWVGMAMDLTLGTYTAYVIGKDGIRGTASGTASNMNRHCKAHMDVAYGPDGFWSRAVVDEVVMAWPYGGDALTYALRSAPANGASQAVSADTSTVVGRIAPATGAGIPVVALTRAMAGQWGSDTPQITVLGRDATVRYRTSPDMYAWSGWKTASSISTEPNAAWIQYEITLNSASAYVDEILLSTAPPPTPPPPSTKAVEPFSLDPLLVVPDGGGVFIQDTLLECKTLDTDSNESTLTFRLSLADPKATHIEPEMPVLFKGRHYVARGITTTIDRASNQANVEVYCERSWYDLLYAGQIDVQTWSTTAHAAISSVLAGTGWYVGQVDPGAVLGWENDKGTVLGVLKQIAKVYGGDLVFDDTTNFVHLLNQGGRDRGTYFEYESGIKSATRRVDTTSLVTRIYGRNAEGLTIAPANNGVPYVQDHTWTDEVRTSVYDFKSGMTPQAMLRFLQAFIANRSSPDLSYEYEVSGLLDRVEEVDRFEVLDIIFVMDEDFSQSVKSRVVSLEIDWVDLRNSRITLANKLRSLASADDSSDPGELTTGTTIDTRDINPFNLLINSRADNGMAHWAGQNVQVVEGGVTGRYSFAFGSEGGVLEQTVASDNRDSFVFSAQVDAPSEAGMMIEVTFQYTDGTTETQTLEL